MAKSKMITKKKTATPAKKTTAKKAATAKKATKVAAKPAKATQKASAKKATTATKKVTKKGSKTVITQTKKVDKKATKPIEKVSAKIIIPNKSIKHIAIAGNIGSGKTTLTQHLSKHYGWLPQFEDVENNPYINDFYEDMPRWSFNLQVYFLNKRFKNIIEIQQGEEVVIQDRTIHEDAHIFAPNLHAMGLMNTRDFENYRNLFETISGLIKPPDLLIYLRASIPTLVNQIQKRGREYEENLRLDYLKRLNEYYEKWIGTYKEGKLLIIDVDKLNFADEQGALGEVIGKIDAELFGLF